MRECGVFSEFEHIFNFHSYTYTILAKGGKIMGEISTLQVVLMGLITVFVVLICLIVIIKLLGMIVAKVTPAKAAAPAVAAAPAAAPAPAAPSANKQQIVAAIAVAIAEEMGTDVSHIRIHSIKRV